MKNPSAKVIVWWRTRNPKRSVRAKHIAEGYGMSELVPGCHVGTISLFEQKKFTESLNETFYCSTDYWFMAPICAPCYRRFADLNRMDVEEALDFELL